MVIVCDVDGVLNNLIDTMLKIYNNKHKTSYTINDVTAYNLENCFDSTVADEMKKILSSTDIWTKVKPVKNSQDNLQKIINKGHQVYLATDSCPGTYGEKVAWIKRFYPFIDDSKIICIKDKWLLKADVMIEDCLQTLLVNPYYHRVLVDRPWNQSTKDWVYDVYRCTNWNEIVDVINKLNNEE